MKALPLEDKDRKALPLFKWLTEYFPDAIVECVKLSVAGNIQHNPELEPADIKWAREKSTQQMDTAFRHMWDHKAGVRFDKDGCYHLAKAAWRILAELQLTIERHNAIGQVRIVGAETDNAVNYPPVAVPFIDPPPLPVKQAGGFSYVAEMAQANERLNAARTEDAATMAIPEMGLKRLPVKPARFPLCGGLDTCSGRCGSLLLEPSACLWGDAGASQKEPAPGFQDDEHGPVAPQSDAQQPGQR